MTVPFDFDLTVPFDFNLDIPIDAQPSGISPNNKQVSSKLDRVYERPMSMGYHYRKSLGSVVRPDDLNQLNKKNKIDIHNPSSIKFYYKGSPYYEFTNFYEDAPIIIRGQNFRTAEHYYQWQKFIDPVIKSRIIAAATAFLAIDTASEHKNLFDPKFSRDEAMLNALRAKFSQHEDLGRILLSTNDRQLIEHNISDDYWSDGGDGSGQNQFGVLLMQVRSELRDGILNFAEPFIG